MAAYYNECDPFAAKWLRNLSAAGLIAPGDVDDRSILDVRPGDLAGYTQHHFFAGIGGWSLALRLAGWPDERPIWTGSCPCQPLSSAGLRQGDADERHLWPAFFGLIAECRPATVSGEQVASKDGREWFAAVRADLETLGYAVGGADLCSPGVGVGWKETGPAEWLEWAILHCPYPNLAASMRDFADWAGGALISGPPNIRQRLYWVANAGQGVRGRWPNEHGPDVQSQAVRCQEAIHDQRRGAACRLANADSGRREDSRGLRHPGGGAGAFGHSDAIGMADTHGRYPGAEGLQRGREHGQQPEDGGAGGLGNLSGIGCEGRESLPGSPSGYLHAGTGAAQWLEHTDGSGRDEGQPAAPADGHGGAPGSDDGALGLGDASGTGLERHSGDGDCVAQGQEQVGPTSKTVAHSHRSSPRHCGWSDADWLLCTDGTYRPVEPGTFPLASGIPGRVGLLRGAGNAINPDLAADFMRAVMEVIPS